MLTWWQLISKEQRGDAATETTSVPLKPLRTALLPTPPGPAPLWGPGSIPNNWADACGSLQPPDSDRYWKERIHSASSIPHKTLGLRPTDQSCHHETWLLLEFVDWRSTQSHHEEHGQRILLKERLTACPYGQRKRRISDIMRDHSLSS